MAKPPIQLCSPVLSIVRPNNVSSATKAKHDIAEIENSKVGYWIQHNSKSVGKSLKILDLSELFRIWFDNGTHLDLQDKNAPFFKYNNIDQI